MKDIFISYAHEDRDTARELAGLLEASGLSVWWDPKLRAGEDFAKIIDQTLQHVHCVIVLWSIHSVDSRWVRAEANEGLRLEKLVPVQLDDSRPPLIFRALHTVRLEPSDLHSASAGLQKLVDDVRARVGSPEAPRAPTAADVPKRPADRHLMAGSLITLTGILTAGWAGLPARALDTLTGVMPALAPLVVEIAIALITFGALAGIVHLWRGHRLSYAVFVLAFFCGSVAYVWIERWLDPPADHLFGRVIAGSWSDLSVSAVDAGGREAALQAVPVSSVDGSFGMRLEPVFANRPRFVVVRRPGCPEMREDVEWTVWREREEIFIEFNCD